jgi:hypothetical protein
VLASDRAIGSPGRGHCAPRRVACKAAVALTLVEFSFAAHATLLCARCPRPGEPSVHVVSAAQRRCALSAGWSRQPARERYMSRFDIAATARDSSRVRSIQRSARRPSGCRAPPPPEREPHACTCDALTLANHLGRKALRFGVHPAQGLRACRAQPAQTSLGTRVGVRRARRRKTRSTLAQPPNLQAARPGAGCTPNRRADHAITSRHTPSAQM